ncbi:gamma-glutamyltransferase family protein [Nocardioides jensenii]|uniref:gamma-glutamyltransferase family protein n=1 Tax=Nocardioides jensenii TaxID=1843 RepID=UPI000ACB6662|nr:gamma-glutamyltransferase [Nocardioides jensenii]
MTTRVQPASPRRTEVLGARGAVGTSSPVVSQVGARVLADGGNAIDATLAMAAAAWMALPGQCGIGGDVFALVREPDGRVWSVNGSGFGPDGGTPDFYRAQGHRALPLTGALAVTVPGALAAIRTLHSGASRSLSELWGPAVDLAVRGLPCTAKTRADIAEHRAELSLDPGASECFLPGGRLPRVGQLLFQRDLGRFLGSVAAGTEGFYDGSFAERAVSLLTGNGAPFSGDEWSAGSGVPSAAAISASYGDLTIHQTPLPTAGWLVLQQAAICDGVLSRTEQLDATAVHWLTGAARRAFRDRFTSAGSDTDAWAKSLAASSIADARAEISSEAVVAGGPQRVAGDTTSTVVVDAEGRAVSFIHSLAFTFGARITVPGTGVVLNNRLGRGAYLIDGHPNEVRPRRKPLHTLNAWIADDDTGLRHLGNCPGGDGQVQWNMQVISHLVDHGNDPQTAVSLPRVTVFPGSDADTIDNPEELRCEPGLAPETLDALRSRGHAVREIPLQVGGPGGSALAITLDHEHGVLRAGVDPRMEGVALAL